MTSVMISDLLSTVIEVILYIYIHTVPDQGLVSRLDPWSCLDDKDLGVWEEGKQHTPDAAPLYRHEGGQQRQGSQ